MNSFPFSFVKSVVLFANSVRMHLMHPGRNKIPSFLSTAGYCFAQQCNLSPLLPNFFTNRTRAQLLMHPAPLHSQLTGEKSCFEGTWLKLMPSRQENAD